MPTLYTKPGCVQCDMLKKRMTAKGIAFDVVDVSTDQAAFDHIVSLGYRSVPVLISEAVQFSGFRPDLLDTL